MRNRQRIRRYFYKGLGCLLSLLVYCLSPGVGQAVFANTEQRVPDVIAKTSGEEQIRAQWKRKQNKTIPFFASELLNGCEELYENVII